MTVDMVNRDPNDINTHLQVAFEDVLAEPDEIHSLDCVWNLSYKCFNCWKKCCYNLFTFFCGCWLAMFLGCDFACISIQHIWCMTPCLREMAINCNPCQKCVGMCCQCIVGPFCEACGQCFSRIKISKS